MMDAGFRPELLGGRWEQSRGPVSHTRMLEVGYVYPSLKLLPENSRKPFKELIVSKFGISFLQKTHFQVNGLGRGDVATHFRRKPGARAVFLFQGVVLMLQPLTNQWLQG